MSDQRKALVNVSGGKGSWATWKVAAQIHGPENTVGLFADTMMEDGDLYRFLVESAANVYGITLPDWWDSESDPLWFKMVAEEYVPGLVWMQDGRDVWQVFKDKRFLGNSRIDPCSKILKRDLIRKYMEEHYRPDEVVAYIGIDWTEGHRFTKAIPYWEPYTVRAPLTEPEHMLDGEQVMRWLESEGIRAPRLYEMGFAHNNCGGFCVKAGQASFRLLLEKMPERFAYHEAKEEELRRYLGKDVAVLMDRTLAGRLASIGLTEADVYPEMEERVRADGVSTWMRNSGRYRLKSDDSLVEVPTKVPMPMRAFRERIEAETIEVDPFDVGGCACFTPDDYAKDEAGDGKVALGVPTYRPIALDALKNERRIRRGGAV